MARLRIFIGSRSPVRAISMIFFARSRVAGSSRFAKPSADSASSYALATYRISSGPNAKPSNR